MRMRTIAAALLAILAADMPAAATRAAAVEKQTTLARAVDATLARWSFNGVALVRRGHGPAVVRAFGIADAAARHASTARTLYQTGSFSKWVASVIVLRLVDRGRLSLDAPIATWLPGYRSDSGARITLHHLLSHTSGIPNDMAAALGKDPVARSYADLSVADAVARYASGDPIFAPGARFDYSHSNWLIVEAIIEKVTDRPYREVVRELLTKPLKLHDSGIIPADFMTLPRAADGYATLVPTPTPMPRERNVPFPAIIGTMGGYYSSVPDMVRLLDAVYDTRFLSPASREALWRVNVPAEHYAYGGRVVTRDIGGTTHRIARNNNSNGAYKTFELRVDDGTTVLLFNNSRIDQQQLNDMGDALLAAAYPSGSKEARAE